MKSAQTSLNQKGLIGWIVLIIIVLLIGGGVYAGMTSKSSIPGDIIYPAKQVVEAGRLVSTELNIPSRAELYMELSSERLDEINKLVVMGKDNGTIKPTLDQFRDYQTKALNNLDRSRGRGLSMIGLIDKWEQSLTKQQEILEDLITKLPEPIYYDVEEALRVTQFRLAGVSLLR